LASRAGSEALIDSALWLFAVMFVFGLLLGGCGLLAAAGVRPEVVVTLQVILFLCMLLTMLYSMGVFSGR
jgi:hypothetical protein